jgi:RHS repeat-associated protein
MLTARTLFSTLLVCLMPGLCWAQGLPSAALGPQSLTLPNGPGSVTGLADNASLDVFSAQVGYEVPLRVPSQGGLAPSLSLDYSGSLGNGTVGAGWVLRVPAIRRSLQKGVPTYSDTDELVLEGMGAGGRLIPVAAGEYRVESQGDTLRVRREGARFEVTDGNGVKYVLGMTANGRQGTWPKTSAWLAEVVVNTAGERLELAYTHDRGEVYVDRVRWGPGQVYRLSFFYQARPDEVIRLKTGSRVVTARRLHRVRIESFAEEIATYHLTYDSTGPLSRLSSVRMTGRAGLGELPVLRFGYAVPDAARTLPLFGTGGWIIDQRGVTFSDVDGDGVSDLLRLEMGHHVFRQNLGGVFASEAPLGGASDIERESSRLVDLDGDARPELVRIVDDTWRAYRLEGARWIPLGVVAGTKGLPLGETGGAVLADLNGDGRTDILRTTGSGLLVHLAARDAMGPAFARPPVSAVDSQVEPGAPSVRVLDWNGDDLADVIWLTDGWMKVFLGRGDGTFEVFDRVFYPWGQGAFALDDLHLADLDRDGLVDLVRVTAGHVLCYAGTGGHRWQTIPRHVPRPESAAPDVLVTTADANGNGSVDLVWSSPRGLWALDLAGSTSASMLASIDNGLGQITTFTYGASGLLSLAAELAGTPWARKLPVSIPVPVRVEQTFADGTPTRTVHLGVGEGFWDGEERRFGGFLVGRRALGGDTAATTRVEETRYHLGLGEDRVLRGQPWYTRVEDGQGKVYSVTESDLRALNISGLPSDPLLRRAAVTETRAYAFEGVTTPLETRTTYQYDAQVRPIAERELGRLDLGGDERTTERVFASDPVTGVRNRVIEETLSTAGGTLVSRRRFYFGDETGEHAWGTVGKGWPTATEDLLIEATGSRWVRLEQARYDARGHVTQASYDDVGRVVSLARNGQAAHANFAYQWVAPRPWTTSFVFDAAKTALPALATSWRAGAPWRESVLVSNSAGEELYGATKLGARWIVSGWKDRDPRGRVVAVADPFYWDSQTLPTTRPPPVTTDTRTYDALDRVTLHTLATGAKTSFAYVAFGHTKSTDELAPARMLSDGLGRVVSTDRTVGGVLETVEATYDAADRVVAMRLLGGAVTHSLGYDTLGRLITATDPDLGARALAYNDAGWIIRQQNGAGQAIEYHYDARADGTTTGRVRGRLGWVSEPTGQAELSYDGFGRAISTLRTIDGFSAAEDLTLSPSGLVLRRSHGDGFAYDVSYDAAARPVGIGTFWEVLTQDAAGRILLERFGNGVTGQAEHDAIGLVRQATVRTTSASALYDVELARNAYGAVTTAIDHDPAGLDHNASFTYDGAARLIDATLGAAGPSAYRFTYGYDGLQNLIARTASGPAELGLLAGTYVYGERGAGPRQLTSVVAPAGASQPPVTTFAYDGAGRQTQDGERSMRYSSLDQLVSVSLGSAGPSVEYGYGFDGLRIKTTHPSGELEYWFSPDLRLHHGAREHYVRLGDRLLARVRMLPPGSGTSATLVLIDRDTVARGLLIACALLLCFALFSRGRPRPRRWASATASLCVLVLFAPACQWIGTTQAPLWTATQTIYFHHGFGAGPVLMTRQDGSVLEERRYEPFGQAIDASRPGSTSSAFAIDHAEEPHNHLNQPMDPTTGWSYHGARWMAPQTGRWLTPDPPVKAPSATFMASPWDLHPCQYARQNPVAYWDADGETALFVWHRDGKRLHLFMVEKGDTLASISRDTGLSEAELLEHNPYLGHALFKSADGSYHGGMPLYVPHTKRVETLLSGADAVGSTEYAYDVEKGITGAGKHKCSAFVSDKKRESGIKSPRRKEDKGYAGNKSYAPAGQLGDPDLKLEHTTVVSETDAKPGQTAAFDNDSFTDASGHVIICAAFLDIWVEGTGYLRASTPDDQWGGIGAGEDDVHYYSGPGLVDSGRGYKDPVFRSADGEEDLLE